MSSTPDHIYLDLSLINNDNTGAGTKTALNFNDVRTNPILENPSNYFLAIARFEVDTPGVTLPVFIPLLNVDGINGPAYTTGAGPSQDVTAYTITMAQVDPVSGLLTTTNSLNIVWNKQDVSAFPPINPSTNGAYTSQDVTTGYYNCYSVEWWLNCVNYTLLQVWLQFTGNAAADAPFMWAQPNTNLISLYTPLATGINFAVQDIFANGIGSTKPVWSGIGATTATSPPVTYALFFNEPLFNLFSSFNSVYFGNTFAKLATSYFAGTPPAIATTKPYLFNYYIQPVVYPNSATYTNPTTSAVFNILTTDFSPVPMWNPVQSLVFTSSLLPVVTSYATQPIRFNDPSILTNTSSGNNAGITNMLSDIQVALTSGTEYKPQVLYVPQNEYRFIDLNGIITVNQASFSVFWKTKYGQTIAFKLGAQCGANIKILFRRKRFNLGNLQPYDTN